MTLTKTMPSETVEAGRNSIARLSWLRGWERAITEVIAETPKIELFREQLERDRAALADVQRKIGELA